MISVCYIVYKKQQLTKDILPLVIVEIDIVLPNNVTIYQSSKQVVNQLFYLITKHDLIWHNKGFARLLKENQMKILLKLDWELKILRKVRVYPLSIKNNKFVDLTFNELHKLGQILSNENATPFLYLVFYIQKT